MKRPVHARALLRIVSVLAGLCAVHVASAETAPAPEACPPNGWQENLPNYLKPGAAFPTQDTPIGARDCAFHEWSWEAFTWATALDGQGTPRFLSLHTPEDLFKPAGGAPRELHLGLRAAHPADAPHIEGAGAIVEADGNLLVAPNGYPIYASVHMNEAYFETAKRNLVSNGGYQANTDADHFPVGAAVFKATWLRLDDGEMPPPGAYVTLARVPVLGVALTPNDTLYASPNGQTKLVKVALLGLHVVGHTINHPEFLWATFEHRLNSPRVPDGTNKPAPTTSVPENFTLYAGNTPFSQCDIPSVATTVSTTSSVTSLTTPSTTVTTNSTVTQTPRYTFDAATQKFSPSTNVVLWNATGSETHSPNGPANIAALNLSAQRFFRTQKEPQSTFAHYDLIGTVWMDAGTYNLNSNQSNAVGSVNLANSTAETFVQNAAGTTTPATVGNCFSCHNPQTFTSVAPMPNLQPRRIALSHVLSAGTFYAVPNQIAVQVPAGTVK